MQEPVCPVEACTLRWSGVASACLIYGPLGRQRTEKEDTLMRLVRPLRLIVCVVLLLLTGGTMAMMNSAKKRS